MQGLLNTVDIRISTTNMASSTSRSSPFIDMSDCDGCLFMLVGSTVSGSSKLTIVAQGATANSTVGAKTYAVTPISSSTGYGIGTGSFDYRLAMVDVLKPHYRYNRIRVDGATGILNTWEWVMIKHHLRKHGSTFTNQSTTIGIGCSTVMATVSTY